MASTTATVDKPAEPTDPALTCDICHKTYTSKKFLNYHYTSTHKQLKKSIKCAFSLLDPKCLEKFRTRKDYEEHLQSTHKIVIIQEVMVFSDMTEFELWKYRMEQRTNSQFTNQQKYNKKKDGQVIRGYKCHRSGEESFNPPSKRKKKTQEPTMGAECPAFIKVVSTDDKVEVLFISTHVGHSLDAPSDQGLHTEAKKRIGAQRMLLNEKQQALNERRIRQEKLYLARRDIINQLNMLDFTAEGEKYERIHNLLQIFTGSLSLFQEAESAKSDNQIDHIILESEVVSEDSVSLTQ